MAETTAILEGLKKTLKDLNIHIDIMENDLLEGGEHA